MTEVLLAIMREADAPDDATRAGSLAAVFAEGALSAKARLAAVRALEARGPVLPAKPGAGPTRASVAAALLAHRSAFEAALAQVEGCGEFVATLTERVPRETAAPAQTGAAYLRAAAAGARARSAIEAQLKAQASRLAASIDLARAHVVQPWTKGEVIGVDLSVLAPRSWTAASFRGPFPPFSFARLEAAS